MTDNSVTENDAMRAQIRYFAALREALGDGESVTIQAGETVATLRARLLANSPAHAQALARGRPVRAAVNQQLCDEEATVSPGDEVAFFPPVTGG